MTVWFTVTIESTDRLRVYQRQIDAESADAAVLLVKREAARLTAGYQRCRDWVVSNIAEVR
jgi:hypothetical protein